MYIHGSPLFELTFFPSFIHSFIHYYQDFEYPINRIGYLSCWVSLLWFTRTPGAPTWCASIQSLTCGSPRGASSTGGYCNRRGFLFFHEGLLYIFLYAIYLSFILYQQGYFGIYNIEADFNDISLSPIYIRDKNVPHSLFFFPLNDNIGLEGGFIYTIYSLSLFQNGNTGLFLWLGLPCLFFCSDACTLRIHARSASWSLAHVRHRHWRILRHAVTLSSLPRSMCPYVECLNARPHPGGDVRRRQDGGNTSMR